MRKLKPIVTFLLLLLFLAPGKEAFSFCDLEFAPIRHLQGGRTVEELSEVRIGTFNVLNLEVSPGKYVLDPETGERVFKSGQITKDREKVEGIARSILDEDLDMVVLQEVEGKASLLKFNEKYLEGKYEVFLQKGNDPRGIEVGFLLKKDLPFKIREQTHAGREWLNPSTGKKQLLFSRDLPALHIRRKTTSMNDPPDFIFAGTHYKSQRNRSGDPRSEKLRTRQVEETKAILEGFEEAYPEVPVFLGGDFNADLHSSPEFKSLFEEGLMRDSFDVVEGVNPASRITHTYHPREGPASLSQLDAILVNEKAASTVTEARVHRYKDSSGRELPLPSTYDERELNPSDHYLVVVKAKLSSLFSAAP